MGDISNKIADDITSYLADTITGFMTHNTPIMLVVISPTVPDFASNR